MQGRAGALCLSSWQPDSLGLRDALPDDVPATRTSARPPHPLNPSHCPYRYTGTRIPVALLLGHLASGMSVDEITDEYDLVKENIYSALAYAATRIEDDR